MQFVDVKNDIAFKKIFGSENKKEILISFLNAVLDLTGNKEIKDISILNPYQTPVIEILKETILDIRATDKRGITFIVEMQVEKKTGFEKRVLYYTSKAYVSQIEKAQNYPRLNQVIFVGIVDFNIFEGEDYITKHLILNTKTLKNEIPDLEFNFIELPKFNKKEQDLKTILDKWTYFVKNAENINIMPKNADFKEIKEAYEEANKYKWSKEELEIYDYWSMRYQDAKGSIEYAKQEGLKEGELKLLIRLLEKKFGKKITNDIKGRISKLSLKRIEIISDKIFEIKNINDLKKLLH